MNLLGMSDDSRDFGSASSWLSTHSASLFPIDTGGNTAGNGGNGYFAGSLIDDDAVIFEPLNVAQAGSHASAGAHQTNIGYFDQAATQIAGIGADGGDGNAAIGGNASLSGAIGSSVIATGDPVAVLDSPAVRRAYFGDEAGHA